MIIAPIHESNDCHTPAGLGGGQFCSHSGLPLKYADQVAKVRGKQFAVHVNKDAAKYGDPAYSSAAAANPDAAYKSYRHVQAAIQRGEERRNPRAQAPTGKGRKTGWGTYRDVVRTGSITTIPDGKGGQRTPNFKYQEDWHAYLRKGGLVPVTDSGGNTWWTKPKAAKRFKPSLTGKERSAGLMTWGGSK